MAKINIFLFFKQGLESYACGVPQGGTWKEILNTDAARYQGCNRGNYGSVEATSDPRDRQPYSLRLYLPPLSTLIFKNIQV